MRRLPGLLLLALTVPVQAAAPPGGQRAIAYGKADGAIPAWAIATAAPAGWTADCCTYARAIGVNFVLYQGEWSGKPDRVMVLNVWPRKLPTLTAEWQADRKHYLQHDPLARVGAFALPHLPLPCHGLLYQGTDHIDDIVVFCDPGKASGIRFSWSMAVAADDPQRPRVSAAFRQVIERSTYMPADIQPADKAGRH